MSHERELISRLETIEAAAPASLALVLLDALASAERWAGGQARAALGLAATTYAAALASGAAQPERAGRDALLAAPLDGLSAEQRCLAASIVAFQREKPRLRRELAFLRLDDDDQQLALRLSAVLALAHALGDPPATLVLSHGAELTTLAIGGDDAERRIVAAEGAAERWRATIGGLALRQATPDELAALGPAAPHDPPPAPPVALDIPLLLRGDEPLAEGARRILRRQFEKLLAREDDVRAAEDPEDIHQMRVATRRLRASLQIVAPLFAPKTIRRIRSDLRRVAASLGAVRDADVFRIHLRDRRDAPGGVGAALDPLISAVERERAAARAALLDALEKGRYARFKRHFARFLTTPGAAVADLPESGLTPRVRDAAGAMIWRRYEDLRAFEPVVPHGPEAQLHLARIAGKRLRYTLELFAEALGPKVDSALDPLAELQETLGELQDSVVARARVSELGLQDDPGAVAYLAEREGEHAAHLERLPRVWQKVTAPAYRRRLAELIVQL